MRNHYATITIIHADTLTSRMLRAYFGGEILTGQADLVLALLRIRDHAKPTHRRVLSYYIRRLVGRPIAVGPPCLLHYYINGHAPRVHHPNLPEERRVIWVVPNCPRLSHTEAALRWREFKAGRTVAQLRSRGVTRRDLRKAERLGWVRFAA